MPDGTAALHFQKLDGSEYPTRRVDIDSSGAFSLTYTPPPIKPAGTYTWWAVDDWSRAGSNVVSFEIAGPSSPMLWQSPSGGPAGTTFKEYGVGFTPGHDVTLHFQKLDGTEYPSQTVGTDSTGYFELTYESSLDKEPGTWSWWAVDDHTGRTAWSSFLITEAGSSTLYISGHTVWGNETWYSGNTYVVQGTITVGDESTLTIEPGVTVKLTSGAQIKVYGTLNAKGVTFTWADGRNQWGGISFEGADASASKMENCIIEHSYQAYAAGGSPRGIIAIADSSPTITGSTIGNSTAATGIWIENGSPTITNNTISGMTGYGVYYPGSAPLDARNNDWSDPSGPLPEGKGSKVSDHVIYYPWIGSTITMPEQPPGGFNVTGGNGTINVKWDLIH